MFVFNGGPTETQALCQVVTEDGIPRASDQRRLVTTSAVHQLSDRIDPTRFPKEFSYLPELFPAVMFRRHGMHFICHLSGKTMITLRESRGRVT